MENKYEARCGLNCEECSYRESQGCPGCVEANGKLFWGECKIAMCSIGKSIEHCGQCETFPCGDLKAFAHDKEHGDLEGSRILNLKKRLA